MVSIFLQYFKYGNVYVYLMEDGTIITLPMEAQPFLRKNAGVLTDPGFFRMKTNGIMRQQVETKKDMV